MGYLQTAVPKLTITNPKETINGSIYRDKLLPKYIKAAKSYLFPIKTKMNFVLAHHQLNELSSVMKIVNTNFERVGSKEIWHGNSPDLNVIEHVWAKLQDSVIIEPRQTNRDSLIERIEATWYSLYQTYLENLLESFPDRIEDLINNEGKHTSY